MARSRMEFSSPLHALWAIAAGLIWALDYWRLGRRAQLPIPLGRDKSLPRWRRVGLCAVALTAWGLLAYALAGPRVPAGYGRSEIEVNDIFLVVDVSHSMAAQDFSPNRLEAAKRKIVNFVDLMPTDRIGIIAFSEQVFTVLPLTIDLEVVKRSVEDIQMGPLGSGTNIGDAIGLATARAADSPSKNKVIVLLTDGVSQVGNMTPMQAAKVAKDRGIRIYSIAIGSDEDAKLTFLGRGRRNIPGGSFDFKTLKNISGLTGGQAFLASDERGLQKVLNRISELEKTRIETSAQVIYQERFYPYLFASIVLLLGVESWRRFYWWEGP